jgi:hypothetical protein
MNALGDQCSDGAAGSNSRTAECAKLVAQVAQFQTEGARIQKQAMDLEVRGIDFGKRGRYLDTQLVRALVPLIALCDAMNLDERGRECHLAPAPSFRTRALVAQLETSILGQGDAQP